MLQPITSQQKLPLSYTSYLSSNSNPNSTFLLLPPAAPVADVPPRPPPAPAWGEALGVAPPAAAADAPADADPEGLDTAAADPAGLDAAAAARLSAAAPVALGCFRSLLV